MTGQAARISRGIYRRIDMGMKNTGALKSLQARIGNALAFLPVTPNQATLASVAVAVVAAYAAHEGNFIASGLFFLAAGALDALDGALARAKRLVSAKGAYIDGISDRVVEFLLVCSLFFANLPGLLGMPAWFWLTCALFFGSVMTSFATAYAVHRKCADWKKTEEEPGILPRTERVLLLCAALFAAAVSPPAAIAIAALAAALGFATFTQRFLYYAND